MWTNQWQVQSTSVTSFFCLDHLLQDETDGIVLEEEGFARIRYRLPVLSTDAESLHAAQGQA